MPVQSSRFATVQAITYDLDSDSIDGSVSIRVTPESDKESGLVELPQMDVSFSELQSLIEFLMQIRATHGPDKTNPSVVGG
jgi:hypothetical protein